MSRRKVYRRNLAQGLHTQRGSGRFKRRFGDWPTRWEFEAWRPLKRRLAREHGNPEPRIPSLQQIPKIFGSFDRAVEVASAQS